MGHVPVVPELGTRLHEPWQKFPLYSLGAL